MKAVMDYMLDNIRQSGYFRHEQAKFKKVTAK